MITAAARAAAPGPAAETETDVVVTCRETAAEGVVALTLRAAGGGPLPAWEPGAHIDLVLAPGMVRQYSLCGDPADTRTWRIAVLREPGGRGGSAHAHDRLAAGDRLRARGPRNHFRLLPAPRYLFVAGGIGITPILPMVAAARAAGADWRLVYGGRRRASMAFLGEVAALGESAEPAVPGAPNRSGAPGGSAGPAGSGTGGRVEVRPQDETGLLDLDRLLGDPRPGTLVYCCGPEPLLAAVEERCAVWPAGALRVERFTAREQDGLRASFEVELAGRGVTLKVPPDASILETAEAAGVTVLSSCREGTCGTCETAVLDGTPDHRDSVLTEEERAAGDIMMICVSRARTARLVLDL